MKDLSEIKHIWFSFFFDAQQSFQIRPRTKININKKITAMNVGLHNNARLVDNHLKATAII